MQDISSLHAEFKHNTMCLMHHNMHHLLLDQKHNKHSLLHQCALLKLFLSVMNGDRSMAGPVWQDIQQQDHNVLTSRAHTQLSTSKRLTGLHTDTGHRKQIRATTHYNSTEYLCTVGDTVDRSTTNNTNKTVYGYIYTISAALASI